MDRYLVSIEDYIKFRRDGFLVVRNLVAPEQVAELRQHTEDLMQGRLPQQRKQMRERETNKDHGVQVQALEAPRNICRPRPRPTIFCGFTCCIVS
jgi:phytanoyl-CoA hydroxylase